MVGLEKHSCSQLSAYSSLKARRASVALLASPARHLAHVAAGGECLLARRLNNDAICLRLARKPRKCLGKLGAHRRGERVERARSVEGDDGERAARSRSAHRRPAAPRNHPPSSALLLHRLAQLCLRRLTGCRNASSIGPIWTYTLSLIATKLARLIRPIPAETPVPPHFQEGGDATMLRFGLGLALALGALSGVASAQTSRDRRRRQSIQARESPALARQGATRGDGAAADGCPAARTQDRQGLPDPSPARDLDHGRNRCRQGPLHGGAEGARCRRHRRSADQGGAVRHPGAHPPVAARRRHLQPRGAHQLRHAGARSTPGSARNCSRRRSASSAPRSPRSR